MDHAFINKDKEDEIEQEKKEAEEAKRKAKQKSLLGFLGGGNGNDDDEGSIEFSLAGLIKVMLFTHPKSVDEKQQLLRIAESLDGLGRRLETLERVLDPHGHLTSRRRTASVNSRDHHLGSLAEDPAEEDQIHDTDSETVASGPVASVFKARIAADLIELRNKSVFAFFMFNALFVLIVFLLQLNKDMLHVDWPLGVKTNITYIEETAEVKTRRWAPGSGMD
ncbi:hypothetical protein C0J52_05691 [Blattella germanica]|nr:hypothetical protein C0J52_05691 [Blattella germanica]